MKKYLLMNGFEGDYLAVYDTKDAAIQGGIKFAQEEGAWGFELSTENAYYLDFDLLKAIKEDGYLRAYPDLIIHDFSNDAYYPFDKMTNKVVKPVWQDENATFPYDLIRFYISGDFASTYDGLDYSIYHAVQCQADLLGIIEIEKILDEEEILNELEYYISEIEYFPTE